MAPELGGGEDLFGFPGGGEFPGEGHFGFEMFKEDVVGKFAGEGDAVIALGPLDVVQMSSDEVRLHFSEPLVVVEEAEVVLEADVAKVVPVSDLRAVGEVLLETDHFALVGDVFVLGSRFNGEDDSGFFSGLDEAFEDVDGTLEILGAGFFASLDAGEFVIGVVVGELVSGGQFFAEGAGPFFVGHGSDGAHVEDDVVGPKLLSHVEGFEGFAKGPVAFALIVG